MTMKMINFNNPNFLSSWGKIFNENKDLPPSLAYKASTLNDYLTEQNKKFTDLRLSIIKKYGAKDEKGELIIDQGNVQFKPDEFDKVNKEFAELMQLDLEPSPPSRLNAQALENEGVRLSGPDISLLKDLLDFGDAVKPTLSIVPAAE